MDKFTIQGNTKLTGQIKVSGSKNSALPIIISSLLTDEKCVIKNVPNLHDISSTIDILQYLGKKVEFKNNTITITKNGCCKTDIPYELVKKMRASFLSAGPLLARYKHATISLPGGCAIGIRPVDIHLKGFSKLGAKIKQKGGDILISAKKLKPAKIILGFPSVGASQNLLMCASLVEGKTILENIAREPEVDDLINCLNGMGAKISYQANKVIVEGVKKLSGINHTVIADRIETGTYLIAAACTKSTIEVINCEPENDE
ncbi:MAG: UDP-N-acetylglucosamine 1-carboxyvinyltransferase, partial [Elusimicrobiaceae bacterium]|nr:UDP-N-acetylglucosamine 1-carboxyvinyltransferase [Elusimicrobiaceae bacterium]